MDELVFPPVPVALAGPDAGLQGQQVDAELGQARGIAQLQAMAVAAGNVEGRGIAGAGTYRRGGEINLRHGARPKSKPPAKVIRGRLAFTNATDADQACGASAFLISSPVVWSTCFIERRTLPRSSKPSSLTFTAWPSLTTSDGLATRL